MSLIHQLTRKGILAGLILVLPVCVMAQEDVAEIAPEDATPEDLLGADAPDEDMVERIVFRDDTTDQILNLLERLTGRSVIRPQALPAATFTFNSQRPMTRDEAILALQSLLSINGIGVSPMGDLFLKVVPLNRIQSEAPEFMNRSTLTLPASGRIVSRMVQLEFLGIEEIQAQLNLMITAGSGSIIPFPKANSLLITDTVSNIQSIERLLAEVDHPSAPRIETRFYPVQYARAPELVSQIQAFAGVDGFPEMSDRTVITADERSNQIILIADRRQISYFENLIEQLDVQAEIVTRNEVIFLKHASAPEVASLLSQLATGRSGGGTGSGTTARPGLTGGAGGGSSAGSRLSGRAGQTTRPGQTNQRQTNQRQTNQRQLQMPQIPGRTNAQSADVIAQQLDGGGDGGGGGEAPSDAAQEVLGDLAGSVSGSDFSESLTILPDERSNAIVISGTRQDIELLTGLIEKIDIILAQVRIEVFIAEVTLNDSDGYGIESFGFEYSETTDEFNFNLSGPGYSIGRESLTWDAALTAAKSNSDIKVLSVPTIVTTHNREATILVGERRPIITGTISDGSFNSSIRSNIQYQDIGIELFVLPLIGTDGTIQLEIEQNVDDVVGEIQIDGNDQPIIGARQATSFVSVANRETVILGGLQSTRSNESRGRLAILGQIPILGHLFSNRRTEDVRTELLVFIRPTVLPSTRDAHEDAQKQIDKLSREQYIRNVMNPEERYYPEPLPAPEPLPSPGDSVDTDETYESDEPTTPAENLAPPPAEDEPEESRPFIRFGPGGS